MSRYLTPSKIGLLVLISLYAESAVPSTATIPILSFMVSHLLPVEFLSSRPDTSLPDQSFVITIDSLQKATITQASIIPGRTVWDLLLRRLWEINSFDALHVFFDALTLLLQLPRHYGHFDSPDSRLANPRRILVSRGSPFGFFVRRSQLEFTRLQFHDGITLWKSFIAYRDPTLALWKRRNPGVGELSFDRNLEEELAGPDDRIRDIVYGNSIGDMQAEASVSTDDVERLLEYQIARMQSMAASFILRD